MAKLKYMKYHNNYDELKIDNIYEGFIYKPNPDWVWISGVLYRQECFKVEE